MNIFYVDKDPVKAAQALCDKHVIKMILESAQMLSTAHVVLESDFIVPYKSTHKNHPSAVWARSTYQQYVWLYDHFHALCDEYTYRYGKRHKCYDYIVDLSPSPVYCTLHEIFTPPPQCMPDEYKLPDTVEAYRNYYRKGKAHLHKWTRREPPEWLNV